MCPERLLKEYNSPIRKLKNTVPRGGGHVEGSVCGALFSVKCLVSSFGKESEIEEFRKKVEEIFVPK
jgi:hypothetical protein